MFDSIIILALDAVQEVPRESALVTGRAVRMEVGREGPVEFLEGLLILADKLVGFVEEPSTEEVEYYRPTRDVRDKVKVLDRPFGDVFVDCKLDVDIATEFVENRGNTADLGNLGVVGDGTLDGFEESERLLMILYNKA